MPGVPRAQYGDPLCGGLAFRAGNAGADKSRTLVVGTLRRNGDPGLP
jgi:hypothetical protein